MRQIARSVKQIIMRQSFIFVFLLLSILTYGQVTIKEIKEVNPENKSHKYIFPLAIVSNNRLASDKINNELVSDFLDIDRKKIKTSIFENIWATKENPIPRLDYLSYKVLSNNKKILTISISAEGCGAYCEPFTNYYTFDLKTGDRVKLERLFSKTGRDLLLDSINSKKKRILKSKIKDIQDTLKTESVQSNKDDKEYFEEMQALYDHCAETNSGTSLEYLRSYVTKTTLFISSDRCSAHYNRNLDEIGDFEFLFKLKNWRKHLTPYAIKLIDQ